MRILIFFSPKYPRFWNLKLDFCPLKKVFEIFCRNIVNHRPINYSWPKFQQICGIFFFTKYPRFWNLKLNFCPIKKVFRRFSKIRQIFFTWTLFLKIKKKNLRTVCHAVCHVVCHAVCHAVCHVVWKTSFFFLYLNREKLRTLDT